MQLPVEIRVAVEQRAEAIGFATLRRAVQELSDAYRTGRPARARQLPNPERVAAYLLTRMPATYAAASAVLEEVRQRLGDIPVATLLDAGAGTGAATLAAGEVFADLGEVTLLEPDGALAEAGREWLPRAVWEPRDLRRAEPLPERDLVVASYALGELPEADAMEATVRLWHACHVALVVIEPGTPNGFALVRRIRDSLLALGAHMLAPCPAETPCPMASPDWCHFSRRVERSSLHRRVKDAALGYEDEKFSYVALVRAPASPAPGRIIRHPQHQPGLITLELCRGPRLESVKVSRRDRERFRAARHARWGDAFSA